MRWVGRWRRAMVSAAVERLGDADAAEDIVQEALAKVLSIARSNPKVVERVRDPRAWLVWITRNLAYDALRKGDRQGRIRLENEDDIRRALFPRLDGGTEGVPEVGQLLDIAQRILTPRQFSVVHLALRGMEDADIALELGLASVTVRRHRGEAIRRLRKELAPPPPPPPRFGNFGGWRSDVAATMD